MHSERYFSWMRQKVDDIGYRHNEELLRYLHNVQFVYVNPMDENRMIDGLDLRYRYSIETGVNDEEVAKSFDGVPCSMLEMMIALALRCEDHIMWDGEDKYGRWFDIMLKSLGLYDMAIGKRLFNMIVAEQIIKDFLNRNYLPNGDGGLFFVEGFDKDMRKMEIWYQMHAYLCSITPPL